MYGDTRPNSKMGECERLGDMTIYKETQGHITFKNMSDLTVKHKVV